MASLTLSDALVERLQTLADAQNMSVEAFIEDQIDTGKPQSNPDLSRLLLENANDGIWHVDMSQRIRYVNPRMAEMAGYPCDEMLGKHISEFFSPMLQGKLREYLQKRQEQGQLYINVTIQRKDGTGKRAQVSTCNAYNDAGDQIGLVAIFRDWDEIMGSESVFHADVYRTVIEAMAEGIIVRNSSGKILEYNDSALRILGISSDELLRNKGLNSEWQISFEDGQPVPSKNVPARITLATGIAQKNVITSFTKPDLPTTWISNNAYPLFLSGSAQPDAVVSIFSDITPFKQVEEALRKSEVQYRTLLESSPVASIIVKFDVNKMPYFMYVNTAAIELYGAKNADELIGKSVFDIIPEHEKSALQERSDAYVSGASSVGRREFTIKRLDGAIRYTSVSSVALEYEGEPAVLSIITDVTSRYEAEQALCRSEERLQLALSNTNTGIWQWDIETNEVHWSKEVELIFGLEIGTFDNSFQSYANLLHPDDLPLLSSTINDVLANPEKQYYVEHRVMLPNGKQRWVSGRGGVFCDDAGKPIRMLGLAENITERKETQLALQKREAQIKRQNEALIQIAMMKALGDGELQPVLYECTRIVSQVMGVSRISVWLYSADAKQIACEVLYNSISDEYESGTVLKEDQYPAYFVALQQNRIIAADDAYSDTATHEFRHDYLPEHDIYSMLDAPIRTASKMVGVVCCEQVATRRQWTVDDQHFMSSVADVVALALEAHNRRQAETALRASKETAIDFQQYLQAIHEITLELSQEKTLPDIYRRAVEAGREKLGFDRLSLLLFDEPNMLMRGTFGTDTEGNLRDEQDLLIALEDEWSIVKLIHSQERTILRGNIPLRDEGQIVGQGWSASAVLWNGINGIGWLANDNLVYQQPPRPYETDLLSIYAASLGNLITQRLSEEQLKQLVGRLTLLAEIDGLILQSGTPETIAQAIVHPLKDLVGCDYANILLNNKVNKTISSMAHTHDEPYTTILTTADGKFTNTIRERLAKNNIIHYVISDEQETAHGRLIDYLLKHGIQSFTLLQLLSEDDIVGMILLGSKGTTPLANDQMESLKQVASQLSVALRQGRLYQQVQDHAISLERLVDRLTLIAEIDRLILRSDSPETIARAIIQPLQDLVGCDYVNILMNDPLNNTLASVAHTHAEPYATVLRTRGVFADGLMANLAKGQDVYLITAQQALEHSRLMTYLLQHDLQSSTQVPLLHEGNLVGVILLGSKNIAPLADDHIESVRQVSRQLSVALRQSALYQQVQGYAEGLEQKVRERTRELQEKAEEMEAFTYSVSHDLRAPLRAINGFSDLLMEAHADNFSDDIQHYLQRIHVNSRRMGQLIDDLLMLSRIGRQNLRKKSVDTHALVRKVVENMRSDDQLGEAIISIDALPECEADSTLLQQVYFNLIANGVKYSRKQTTPTIHIGYEVDALNNTIYFVRDNGVGFDMKYVDKLFGVFQRLHDAREYEGTGIGLATIRRIINRHGGKVWAKATVHQGATFYFTLSPSQAEPEF